MAQGVKNPSAMQKTQETWAQSLDWEDQLEEENGNPLQYSCLKKSHGQRTLVGYNPKGPKELEMTKRGMGWQTNS